MVRLVTNKGYVIKKVFNSADEARRWFTKNKDNYGTGSTARIISESKYKKGIY